MFNKNKSKKKQSLGRVGRVEREQRYNQMIRITTFSVVGLVLLVTVIGIVYNTLVVPSRTLATVDGQEILVSDFQQRVKLERGELVSLYNRYYNDYQTYQQFAQTMTDATQQQQILGYLQQIQATLQQIEFQLGPENQESFGTQIMNQMIDEIFIVKEAESRGITVTDEEIDEVFQGQFGYYPGGFPTPEPTTAPLPTSTLSPTQVAMLSPTPEPTQAEDQAEEATPAAPADQALPTSVTEEEFEANKEPFMDELRSYGYTEEEYKEFIRVQLYRQKLNADIEAGITPPTEEQVRARHILVEDLETAEDIRQQLDDGGDFGDLAREFSTDGSAASGGDLGWFPRGRMVEPFEEAAFGAEVGEIVGPVESQFGYHLIQVLGKEERPASASAMDNLVFTTLTDILNQYKEEADIEFGEEDWVKYTPNEPDILRIQQSPIQ